MSDIEAATAHNATAIAYTVPGTIKPTFEPTATAPEKMAKPFNCVSFPIFKKRGKEGHISQHWFFLS